MGVRRPLVAISEGFADYGDYYGVGYPRPVLAAGGFPVLLPYLEEPADRREVLERADGLVLAGGRDIEPWRYGRSDPHPGQLPPEWKLDEIELDYAKAGGGGRPPRARDLPRLPDPQRGLRRNALRRPGRVPGWRRGSSGRQVGRVAGARRGHARRRTPSAAPHASCRHRRGVDPRRTPGRARRRRQLPPSGDPRCRRGLRGHGLRTARSGGGDRDARALRRSSSGCSGSCTRSGRTTSGRWTSGASSSTPHDGVPTGAARRCSTMRICRDRCPARVGDP